MIRRKTSEENVQITQWNSDKDSPILQQYNGNKDVYIKYATKLDYILYKNKKEAKEFAKSIDNMFTYFIENFTITCDETQTKNIVWIYFIACCWVIIKYCHDEYLGGYHLCRMAKIHIKDLVKAEIKLLNVIQFDIRRYLGTCDENIEV